MKDIKTGKVENIRFTNGSPFGEQWTTIAGTEYATWWDARTKDWKVGDTVQFHLIRDQECHVGHGVLTLSPCATIIGKISPSSGDTTGSSGERSAMK